jgi:hypothetical protein
MASSAREVTTTRRLFDMIGLVYSDMRDPLKAHGRETGADVEIRVDGRRIGIQVTEFACDEGVPGPGHRLRAIEKFNATRGIFPTYAVPLQNQLAALRLRVLDKINKATRYTFEEFDEPWLVIAAAVPDAVVSTFLFTAFMRTDGLNAALDDALSQSKYARAFLCIEAGATVYEWTATNHWQCISGREGEQHVEPRWLIGYVQDGPLHDAGFRCFIVDRRATGNRVVAYTLQPEDAEMILAALEAVNE